MVAIRSAEANCRVILVDDGVAFGAMEINDPQPAFDGMERVFGEKPFAFPRNVNIGIKAAGDDDIVILNDDALLETSGGFSRLQRAAEEHPEYGIISATTNVAGNPSQKPHGIGLREECRTVAFVCVYVPRSTIEKVGIMDERFGGPTPAGKRIYGFCDNDYCRRVREAGLKIGIHDGCFVDHGSLRSSFRGDPHAAGDISAGMELYQAKWGDLN